MKYAIIGLMMFLSAALIGCSEKSTTPDITADTSASTLPPEVQKLIDEYVDVEADISPDIAFDAMTPGENLVGFDVFSVTFLWGDIFGNSPDVQTTDWSGSLHVNGQGHVRVGYEIDFEPGEDYILPAVSVDQVHWVSYTTYDVDGINFIVFISPVSPDNVPASITFETGPLTLNLTYRQLFRHAAFYPVDDSRGVVVHSQVIWQNSCPGGTMVGQWIKETNNSNQGHFQGEWIDHTGEPVGYMSGQFWTNEDGTRQFSGDVSGITTDQVIAELNGVWAYDDPRLCPVCGDDHGFFRGRFHYIDGSDRRGFLKGIFGDYNLSPDLDTLPYYGIWREHCTYVSPDVPNANSE